MPLRSNGPVNRRPAFSGGNLYHVVRAVAFKASAQLCLMLFVTKALVCLQKRLILVFQTVFIAYSTLDICSRLKGARRNCSFYF